jgi:hypothetical protein
MTKYHNVKTTVEGIEFDSRAEANRYAELRLMEKAGEIRELRRQVTFVLAPAIRVVTSTRTKPALRYIADFTYLDLKHDRYVVEDVKSAPTAQKEAFRIKLHLMKSVHGIDVHLVKH